MAQVEPLPLVPATSAIRTCRSGAPARSSNARVRPSFHCVSGLARGFQPTPRSWSARLKSQPCASCTPALERWNQERERVQAEQQTKHAECATNHEEPACAGNDRDRCEHDAELEGSLGRLK